MFPEPATRVLAMMTTMSTMFPAMSPNRGADRMAHSGPLGEGSRY